MEMHIAEVSSLNLKATLPPTQGPISPIAPSPNQNSHVVGSHLKSLVAGSPPPVINRRSQSQMVRLHAP
ncbi:hypothetical protein M5689_010645 [Euphorbia peplus]|nr:hypothetical protein M5689_010645 [Euphorbia peplus]